MDHIRSSVVELLERERKAQQSLTLTAIRTQRAVELFQYRMAQLDAERVAALQELEASKDQLRQHQLLAEVCGLPSELAVYASTIRSPGTLSAQCALLEIPHASTSLFIDIAVPADRVNGKRTRNNQGAFDRCVRDGAILTCTTSYDIEEGELTHTPAQHGRLTVVHDIPAVSTAYSFIPINDNGSIQKRPVGGDLAVCVASQIDMGRVLVNKRPVHGGDVLFVDSPFFTAIDDGSRAVFSDVGSALWSRIRDKKAVFEAQRWDMRLASAFCQYVDIITLGGATSMHLRDASTFLGCPLESMDADQLNGLCDYSKFLHAALPGPMHNQLSEDDITTFLVTFQTNAVAHGGPMMGDAELSSEVKRSLFGYLSMVEHSCDPNCVVVVRKVPDVTGDASQSMYVAEVRAVRPIGVGERLSIAYVSLLPSTMERRHALRNRYSFICMCPRCTSQADVTRTLLSSSDEAIVPLGDGARWLVGAALVDCTHPEVQGALLAERRLADEAAVNRADLNEVDRCAHYNGVLTRWLESDEKGYLRLAPYHCTVVAVAVRLAGDILQCNMSEARLLIDEHVDLLLSVLARLVATTLSLPLNSPFVTTVSGSNTSLAAPPSITIPASAYTILTSAVVPLAESCATLLKLRGARCERQTAWVWYAVAKLIAGAGMGGSDRWLRAQLYTAPLARN